MNQFALIAIGILLGSLLAAILLGIATMIYFAWSAHRESTQLRALMARAVARNTAATDKLRAEVTLALSNMDAERLHAASAQIQHGVKRLVGTVATLHRLVFAAGGDTDAIHQAAAGMGAEVGGYGTQSPGALSEMDDDYVEPEQQDYRTPDIGYTGPTVPGYSIHKDGNPPAAFAEWAKRHNPPETPAAPPHLPDLEEGFEQDAIDAADAVLPDVD